MTRLLVVLTACLLTGACSSGAEHRASPTTTGGAVVDVGTVGNLPPRPTVPSPTAKLAVPLQMIEIPGRFPVGTIVTFRIPFRNDGREPLAIDKIEPG